MARDRKRAKQRRGSRGRGAPADARQSRAGAARAASPAAAGSAPVEPPSPAIPAGSGPPTPVDHASGEVEEFDAALARGAAGVFAEPATDEPLDETADGGNGDVELATLGERDASIDEDEGVDGGGNGGAPPAGGLAEAAPEPARRRRAARSEPRAERQSLWARAIAFLRASWAELQRMQWPDRRQTSQATAVVLGFVVVAGIYLGIADWIAQKIVNLII